MWMTSPIKSIGAIWSDSRNIFPTFHRRKSCFFLNKIRVRVTRFLVLCVCFVYRWLSFCPFSFGHCVACPSIYGFWLPLWYLQTLLRTRYEWNISLMFIPIIWRKKKYNYVKIILMIGFTELFARVMRSDHWANISLCHNQFGRIWRDIEEAYRLKPQTSPGTLWLKRIYLI